MRQAVRCLLLLSGLPGCIENGQSLTIDHLAVHDPTMCSTAISTSSSLFQSEGILDVGLTELGLAGYRVAPIIVNNMIVLGNSLDVERLSVQVTGVNVELRGDVAAALKPEERKYFVPGNGGLVLPGGISTNGASTVMAGLLVVPWQIARKLAPTVAAAATNPPLLIVRLWPVGILGGTQITGGASDLPIRLCQYCLTSPRLDAWQDGRCPMNGVASNLVHTPCIAGQDNLVTCCKGTTSLLCGAEVPLAATQTGR